jgi:hypothetical protein
MYFNMKNYLKNTHNHNTQYTQKSIHRYLDVDLF